MKNLRERLHQHALWLQGEEGGIRFEAQGEDLSELDFSGVNLAKADLRETNLRGADCRKCNLTEADLSGAVLEDAMLNYVIASKANLTFVDFHKASLVCARMDDSDLRGASLTKTDASFSNFDSADLRGVSIFESKLDYARFIYANLEMSTIVDCSCEYIALQGANLSRAAIANCKFVNCTCDASTAFFTLQCPEEGAFIAWKRCSDWIVKLQVTERAKRSSATSRKCRCSEALVLDIQNLDGTTSNLKSVCSDYDSSFVYRVGKIVRVDNFNENRWSECTAGIHFFITREEAVNYRG